MEAAAAAEEEEEEEEDTGVEAAMAVRMEAGEAWTRRRSCRSGRETCVAPRAAAAAAAGGGRQRATAAVAARTTTAAAAAVATRAIGLPNRTAPRCVGVEAERWRRGCSDQYVPRVLEVQDQRRLINTCGAPPSKATAAAPLTANGDMPSFNPFPAQVFVQDGVEYTGTQAWKRYRGDAGGGGGGSRGGGGRGRFKSKGKGRGKGRGKAGGAAGGVAKKAAAAVGGWIAKGGAKGGKGGGKKK